MERIVDTINVEGEFMDGDDDVAGFTLNGELLACWWIDPSGGKVGSMMPRKLAMQIVRAIASSIEETASEVMRDGGGGFDSIGTYAGAMTLDAPINVAFAFPINPADWSDDDEEIVGASVGGGWSSVVRTELGGDEEQENEG